MTTSPNPTIQEVGVNLDVTTSDVVKAAQMAGVNIVGGRISMANVGKIRQICDVQKEAIAH